MPETRALTRRLLSIPALVLAAAAVAAGFPLLLPLALVIDAVRGHALASRGVVMAAIYLACEVAGLAASLALWLARPLMSRERWLERHYALQHWWASSLLAAARSLFSLQVEIEGDADLSGPVVVFIRHASIVDTLLPAALLTGPGGLRLRYVLKRELLADPCLDVVGNRLPNVFVRRGAGDPEVERVAALARGLGAGEGVLIYPEGTRFTPAKRARALDRLAGTDVAARAAALGHVLPPRPGGPLALLEAAPDADALFVAHVGLDGLATLADVWRGDLVGSRVRVALWRVDREQIPNDANARLDWLWSEWARMDAWVAKWATTD